MTRLGRLTITGLLCATLCGSPAAAQTSKLDELRAIALFVPPEGIKFVEDTGASARLRYNELKKKGIASLDTTGLQKLCEVCSALDLDTESVAVAQEGVKRLREKAKTAPLGLEDAVQLAKFLMAAHRCTEALDLLSPMRAGNPRDFRYWLALGSAQLEDFLAQVDASLPANAKTPDNQMDRVGIAFQQSPPIKERWAKCAEILTESLAKARSLAKTKLDDVEVCRDTLGWSEPPDLIGGLPGTATQLNESTQQAHRRYLQAQIDALSEAPVDAEHAGWLAGVIYLVKDVPIDATQESWEKNVAANADKALAYIWRAKLSSDPVVRSFVGPTEPTLLLVKQQVDAAVRLIDANADAFPTELWAITSLFIVEEPLPGMDDRERTRLLDNGLALGEAWLKTQNDPQLRRVLIYNYWQRGNLDKIWPHIDVMLRADPKDPEANLDQVARLLRRPGTPVDLDGVGKCLDLANAGLDKATANFNAAYRADLAIYAELKGDHERARALIDLAAQAAPESESIKKIKRLLED